MAGTVVVSSRTVLKNYQNQEIGERIVLLCTADGALATYPNKTITDLKGALVHIGYSQGATVPTTALTCLYLYHPTCATLDALGGAMANIPTTAPFYRPPKLNGMDGSVLLNGDYVMTITGNAVVSAVFTVWFEVVHV